MLHDGTMRYRMTGSPNDCFPNLVPLVVVDAVAVLNFPSE
jgi:hypothetical protein